jgi:hypothetical protein
MTPVAAYAGWRPGTRMIRITRQYSIGLPYWRGELW